MKIKGNQLELIAAQKGMTIVQLAEKAGLCRQNLSIIKNRGTCRPITAVRIANALGVDVNEIIEQEV
ncbi:MAG: helix-turn-helix domain-containing protein [Faecalibacterium sp.]